MQCNVTILRFLFQKMFTDRKYTFSDYSPCMKICTFHLIYSCIHYFQPEIFLLDFLLLNWTLKLKITIQKQAMLVFRRFYGFTSINQWENLVIQHKKFGKTNVIFSEQILMKRYLNVCCKFIDRLSMAYLNLWISSVKLLFLPFFTGKWSLWPKTILTKREMILFI